MGIDLRRKFYNLITKVYRDVDYPNMPIPIYAVFYVIMSQYFKNVKIIFGGEEKSLRLSFFLISPSRTGKGQLCKMAKTIAERIGLTTAIETDITDAGLLGSIDEKAIEYNLKNKLIPVDDDYKNPVIYGDLFNYDILFFREVKKLLIPTPNTEMLLSILQEALDEPGHVRKKLRSKYPIEGESTVSIIATTYYMPEIEKTLAEQGFFMRVPIYCRDFSIQEITDLRNVIIDFYGVKDKNIEKDINEFVSEINKIENKDFKLIMDKSAIEELKKINSNFCEIMKTTIGNKLRILKGISQTIIDISTKIGGIQACLESKKEITSKHIISASTFVKSCIDTILNKIELVENKNTTKESTIRRAILLFREMNIENESISKEVFSEKLKMMNYGRNRALNFINMLISENYLIVKKGEKNKHCLFLNQGI